MAERARRGGVGRRDHRTGHDSGPAEGVDRHAIPYDRFDRYRALDEEPYELDRDYVESRWGTRELAPPPGYGSMERSSRDRPLGPPYEHHDPSEYLGRGAAMGYDGESVVMRPEPGEAGYVALVGEEPRRGPKGYRRSDARIREDVCQAMTDHPRLDCSEIEVFVEDGQVILEGTVRERWLKRLAEDVAYTARGVEEVLNRIRLRREPAESSDALAEKQSAEKQSAERQSAERQSAERQSAEKQSAEKQSAQPTPEQPRSTEAGSGEAASDAEGPRREERR